MRRVSIAVIGAAILASCAGPSRDAIPITPPSEVASAPVARVPLAPTVPPSQTPSKPSAAPTGGTQPAVSPSPASSIAPSGIDPARLPAGSIYVCANIQGADHRLTAIQFEPKVGELCRRHPEMGPCQYERNLCRQSGGRVFAADGREITMATEAEYDRKVMRVRFKTN